MRYAINKKTTANEIKKLRKDLRLTQKEFAELLGVSKPTVERWEASNTDIEGPIATTVWLMTNNIDLIYSLEIPAKKTNMRLSYMYKDDLCTLIDVDEVNQKIYIKNYKTNNMFKAFGVNENPTYDDYLEFIESRCFPRTRDKMKIMLRELNIPFYDPILIIEKTKGRMAEDDFWIDIERN